MKSTRRGSDLPVHRREKNPRFQIPLDKCPCTCVCQHVSITVSPAEEGVVQGGADILTG